MRSTFDARQTMQYSSLLSMLSYKAHRLVRDIEPVNDLEFLRVRTSNMELLVSPGREYILVVIQEVSKVTEP